MQKKPRRWRLPAEPPRHGRGLLSAGAVVLLGHLMALGGLRWTWDDRDVAPRLPGAVEVRTLTAAPQRAVQPPPDTVEVIEAVPVSVPKRVLKLTKTALPAGSPNLIPLARPPAVEPERPAEAPARIEVAAAVADDDDEAIPNYRTVLPPPATLRYEVRRGPLRGIGVLRWRVGPEGYELTLDIDAGDGPALLAQSSRGAFDAAGLAPTRFTEKRQRRPVSAANFQRDAARITFSGPSTEYPLRAGSQDRLSALLQLAAIVAAEPALREKGARVVMNVVGAHGDAAVWAFVCDGADTADSSGSAADVGQLGYRREARGPYDTAATVVLDPAHGYLPSRITLRSGPNSDALELRLTD